MFPDISSPKSLFIISKVISVKIYIKRDKSNERSRYIIYSESSEELYTVVGECKGRTERAYVLCKGRCVAKIRDTRLFMFRTCYVFTNDDRFHIDAPRQFVCKAFPNRAPEVSEGSSFVLTVAG